MYDSSTVPTDDPAHVEEEGDYSYDRDDCPVSMEN